MLAGFVPGFCPALRWHAPIVFQRLARPDLKEWLP